MKFSDDVTKENIAEMMDAIIHDLREYGKEADDKFAKNKQDKFQRDTSLVFNLAADMIENRMSALTN